MLDTSITARARMFAASIFAAVLAEAREGSDCNAVAYIIPCQICAAAGHDDFPALEDDKGVGQFFGKVKILFDEQDCMSPFSRKYEMARPMSLMIDG